MTKLDEFIGYLRDRDYALADLDRFKEIIEPITETVKGVKTHGYRIKPLQPGDHIKQKCKVLAEYAWHCRDYVKKILIENKVSTEPGYIINERIKVSPELQLVSYLANAYKHAGTDQSQKWATDIEPRFGMPYVFGRLLIFPGPLKPFIRLKGDNIPGFEFTGHAQDQLGVHWKFEDFTWTFSCEIEDKKGKIVGNAFDVCEKVFEIWINLLREHGIALIKKTD